MNQHFPITLHRSESEAGFKAINVNSKQVLKLKSQMASYGMVKAVMIKSATALIMQCAFTVDIL